MQMRFSGTAAATSHFVALVDVFLAKTTSGGLIHSFHSAQEKIRGTPNFRVFSDASLQMVFAISSQRNGHYVS